MNEGGRPEHRGLSPAEERALEGGYQAFFPPGVLRPSNR